MRRRQQSYRKNWVAFETRQKFADVWARVFWDWRQEYLNGRMSGPEICARLIDRCWRDLFPQSWGNGDRVQHGPSASFLDEFLSQRYRALPEAVPSSLAAWAAGAYPLELYFRELDVTEIMKLQSHGRRCVSLMMTKDELLNFEHEGRDFLSFLIHDLVHAHRLMKRPEDYRRQCEFAKLLFDFRAHWVRLDRPLAPQYRERLDYIGADMNSHLIHLLKTLKALTDEIASVGFSQALEAQFRQARLPWDCFVKLNGPGESAELHLQFLELWSTPCPRPKGLPLGPKTESSLNPPEP